MKFNTLATIAAVSLCFTPFAYAKNQASAENNQNTTETKTAAKPAPVEVVDADPALWVVKDEDTTIYLFGTVHILKPGLSWFDEAIKDAFDKSDELVVEMVDPPAAEMQKLVGELAIDQTGKSLRSKLDADARKKYEDAMASYSLPLASFDPLEPWFASVTLAVMPLARSGYQQDSGAEAELTSNAKASGKKISGLETARQQLGYFDNLPEEIQIKFLNSTVEHIDETTEGMANMVDQWAKADIEGLAESMNAGLDDPLLFKTLLTNRNANWAKWVKARMDQPGTVFLAVGAGHLAGEGSLQKQLKALKITSERIKY